MNIPGLWGGASVYSAEEKIVISSRIATKLALSFDSRLLYVPEILNPSPNIVIFYKN
jgi:hypothetical protein